MANPRTDLGRAFAHAYIFGPAVLPAVILLGGSPLAFQEGGISLIVGLIPLAALFWAFSLPIWALGLAAGVMVWRLIERIGGGGPWQAALLGGASVSLLWLGATKPLVQEDAGQLLLVTTVGAASGVLAGYVGWRAGQTREIAL